MATSATLPAATRSEPAAALVMERYRLVRRLEDRVRQGLGTDVARGVDDGGSHRQTVRQTPRTPPVRGR